MSIDIDLSNPNNGSNTLSLEELIRANNAKIVEAFTKVLSRHGGDLNYMWADLDMNGKKLLNVGDSPFVRMSDLNNIAAGEFRVNDTTGDLEYRGPNTNDPWTIQYTKEELRGAPGINGTGTGDMLSSNNLSELTDSSAARTNVGLEIGLDVLAYSADLDGFDPSTKADTGDSRFSAYPVITYTSNSSVTDVGTLYRFEGTAAGTSLTVNAASDGEVITVHNPADSSVSIVILAGTGVSLFLSGATASSSSLTLGAGGTASIICSHSSGTSFIVSGTNLSET